MLNIFNIYIKFRKKIKAEFYFQSPNIIISFLTGASVVFKHGFNLNEISYFNLSV